jgi:hypothetical protein
MSDARRAYRRQRNYERRAKRHGLPSERFKVREIYERDEGKCYLCHEQIDLSLKYPDPMSFSIEHIIPLHLASSPGHVRTNVRAAHQKCNWHKNGNAGLPERAAAILREMLPERQAEIIASLVEESNDTARIIRMYTALKRRLEARAVAVTTGDYDFDSMPQDETV